MEIGISGSLNKSKNLMKLILTPVVNFSEDRKAQLAKSILLISMLAPLRSFQTFKVCSDAKERERGAKSNGKLPHLGKSAALVPEFAVDDLPSAELQPTFLCLQ